MASLFLIESKCFPKVFLDRNLGYKENAGGQGNSIRIWKLKLSLNIMSFADYNRMIFSSHNQFKSTFY